MITSQTLGTTLFPVSIGGHLVEVAVELARGAAARLSAGLDQERLRAHGDAAAALLRLTAAEQPAP